MKTINLKNIFENLTFSQKTKILNIIMTIGMLAIILFSQVSLYILKSDLDVLFEKRMKSIIYLTDIKDIYKINIYDTLKDLYDNDLTFKQAKSVILLGQYLINKKWKKYNKISFNSDNLNFIEIFIKEKFVLNLDNKSLFKKNIIKNINKRQTAIDKDINNMIISFKNNKKKKLETNIQNLYLNINSIDISLSNLSNYDMNLAIEEKNITENIFNTITTILNIFIIVIFIVSILLSVWLLRYFDKINLHLEEVIGDKTKELRTINKTLKHKIKKEVEISRKKDLVIYQQAKLASLGEMLNNIAHQWRQPLSSLLIIMQSVQSKMELGKLTLDIVEKKTKDTMFLVKNMSSTLEDFRNFFNPNKDKALFLISSCIHQSLELSKYILNEANIIVKLDIINDIKIYNYYNELSHILLNIISNSKDALKSNNKSNNRNIKISVFKMDNNIIIECIDNGGGIDDDILPNIFDPYYTTKYKSAGTGIGLYMSKQIIEKHMLGALDCENIKFDNENGAKFTITIALDTKKEHSG